MASIASTNAVTACPGRARIIDRTRPITPPPPLRSADPIHDRCAPDRSWRAPSVGEVGRDVPDVHTAEHGEQQPGEERGADEDQVSLDGHALHDAARRALDPQRVE